MILCSCPSHVNPSRMLSNQFTNVILVKHDKDGIPSDHSPFIICKKNHSINIMNPGLGLQGCIDQQPHVLSLMLHGLPFVSRTLRTGWVLCKLVPSAVDHN
ncbi:hypothetical protein NXS19_003691 [Fusarium pseudograminearum]|nr:hypothetical protein NXS19_003691 [Fusarium pseudograminearum]